MRSHHVAIALLSAQLASCQAIAGIEDRHLDADAAAGQPLASAATCKSYCAVVMATCKDPQQVYPSEQVCRNVCMQLPARNADGDDSTGNTIACRDKIAHAASGAMEGLEDSCPKAGPGGADTCGSDCESYCYLFARACPDDAIDDCEAKCKGLRDKPTFDAVTVDHDGDSLQCRLVHVSNAVGDAATHCKHARLIHPEGYCADDPKSDLDCGQYCHLVNTVCNGSNQVYETDEQCQATCTALGPGKVGDQSVDPKADSMACRLWHGYTAALDPEIHCSHAGPSGDGHCGDGSDTPNCAPYCRLLEKGCKDQFDAAFGGDQAKCKEACAPLKGSGPNSDYTVKTATEDASSFQCRMLHATRAVAGDEQACEDAFGDGKHCHD